MYACIHTTPIIFLEIAIHYYNFFYILERVFNEFTKHIQ